MRQMTTVLQAAAESSCETYLVVLLHSAYSNKVRRGTNFQNTQKLPLVRRWCVEVFPHHNQGPRDP
jgi:hypothetical protein